MRTPDRRARAASPSLIVAAVALAWLVAACSALSAPPTPTPTPSPAPTATPYAFPTPWPHMTAPARADDVYLALLADDIVISPISADSGGAGHEPVKRINATYDGWPLAISQYQSAKSLKAATRWTSGSKPGRGEAPFAFTGENILVQWGPISSTAAPKPPDDRGLASAQRLRDALDRLVSPLVARTIVPIPQAAPASSPAASAAASAGAGPSAAAASAG